MAYNRIRFNFDQIIYLLIFLCGCLFSAALLITSGKYYFIFSFMISFLMFLVGSYLFIGKNFSNLSKQIAGSKAIKKPSLNSFGLLIERNIYLVFAILGYVFLQVWIIKWGVPEQSHPFPYHMDEWHQLQALRGTLLDGSPNIEGSAHGTVLHFIISGFYIAPFVIFKIIDPQAITSSIDNLHLQTQLFGVLRSNTIVFGVGVFILLTYICSKFFNIGRGIVALLLILSPSFMLLSNYYKYDISLLFWISLAYLFILRFCEKKTLLSFVLAAIFSALAISIKVSAIPLIFACLTVLPFVIGRKSIGKFMKFGFTGLLSFTTSLYIFGFPDVFATWREYLFYVLNNTADVSSFASTFTLGMPFYIYALLRMFPWLFGYGFFALFIFSVFYLVYRIKSLKDKERLFIIATIVSFALFSLSLLSMKWQMGSNRPLVLLPFVVAIIGFVATNIYKRKKKIIFGLVLFLILIIQLIQVIGLLAIKLEEPSQKTFSTYLSNKLDRKSLIGIENVPIYQLLPEIVVKEFYDSVYGSRRDAKFKYQIVSHDTKSLPQYVLVTNSTIAKEYFRDSAKKKLIERLEMEGYIVLHREKIDSYLVDYFGTPFDYYLSGLIAMPYDITIYKK